MRTRNRRALGTRAPVGPLCYALGILALFDPMPNEAGEGGRTVVGESIYRLGSVRLDSIPRFHYYPHLILDSA